MALLSPPSHNPRPLTKLILVTFLNIGSGDSEGNSNGDGLKNEFDYYGFGVYSATNFGNFALAYTQQLTLATLL